MSCRYDHKLNWSEIEFLIGGVVLCVLSKFLFSRASQDTLVRYFSLELFLLRVLLGFNNRVSRRLLRSCVVAGIVIDFPVFS